MDSSNQIIIIKLDGFLYGIPVDFVQEVLFSSVQRELPDVSNFLEGVSYIRESLVPIIRLKRLMNSPYFDIYANKKTIIMNFYSKEARVQKEQDVNSFQNVQQLGILVDEIIGIHIYSETEVKEVGTIYNASITEFIYGFINKDNEDVAIFNIRSFFFKENGEFRFLQLVKKFHYYTDIVFTQHHFKIMKELLQKVGFPINSVSKDLLINFFSKSASLEQKTVENYLEDNKESILKNVYLKVNSPSTKLFENQRDMQVILECITSNSEKYKKYNVLLIDSGDSFNTTSVGLILDVLKKTGKDYLLKNMGTDKEIVAQSRLEYQRESLSNIPLTTYPDFFNEQQDGLYHLKPRIASSITIEDLDFEKAIENNEKFKLIYAPNFLISDMDNIQKNIQSLEKMLLDDGVLLLGLFEDIGDLTKLFKKHYIKNRLIFIKS